jgi:hypothetical protein
MCTIGPSRPTEPPVARHSDVVSALAKPARGRTLPCSRATAYITSGTPLPRASRAQREISGPYNSPPTTGMTT